jgi:predicted transposase YdaD
LILLRPMPNIPESPIIKSVFDSIEVWRFNYVVIKLWEISAEELIAQGLLGLLPLVPLTRHGTRPEILSEVANTLFVEKEGDLLALTKMVAGLVLKRKPEKAEIERIFEMYRDILEDSWVYQEVKQQAIAEGKAEWKAEGKAEGRIEIGQRILLAVIQRRFPDILGNASKLIVGITDATVLEEVAVTINVAQTPQEAMQALNAASKK